MGWLAILIGVTALHSDGNWKCTIIVCNATQNAGCCEIFCKYIGFDCNFFFFGFFAFHRIGSDCIARQSREQRQDINCVGNHSVRNAAIMHYTSPDSNLFIAIQCIMHYTSLDSNFFIAIQCIMYYTSAQSNFFILIQSMHCIVDSAFLGQSLYIKHLMT